MASRSDERATAAAGDVAGVAATSLPRRVVVVGAGGGMARVIVEALHGDDDLELVLGEPDVRRLADLVGRLPHRERVRTATLDLFAPADLRAQLTGADLVVNCAGPYYRTAGPVIAGCLAAGVDYLDLGDDIEAAQFALACSDEARAAGVRLFIGCGISPGLTNVLARELIEALDEARDVDVAWVVGDEGDAVPGRAVLEHFLHMAMGSCPSWREGGPARISAFRLAGRLPFAPPLDGFLAYEVAHPEVVTIPRHYPQLRTVRCYGTFHPQPRNGVLRGLGDTIERGQLTAAEAVAFLQAMSAGRAGSLRGWRAALAGLAWQVRRKHIGIGETGRFLLDGLLGRHAPAQGGALARVSGIRDGRPVTLL